MRAARSAREGIAPTPSPPIPAPSAPSAPAALADPVPDGPAPADPLERTLTLLREELERRCPADATGVDAMSRSALLPPGKLLRPLLFTESAAALGLPRAHALGPALGIESLHSGSLVHDDVIDGDELRRGRPTVVARHGMPNAIVTGDALIIDAFRAVAGDSDDPGNADGTDSAAVDHPVPDDRRLAVVRVLAEAGVDLCRGQALEDELRAWPGCGLERYLKMIALKTGALFRAACVGGALLAGGQPTAREALRRYAEHLGRAFQMADDLLPYLSDDTTSGKPVLSDLANSRPTLPVLLCWQWADERDRRRLTEALDGTVPPEEALRTVRTLLTVTGALELARADALAESARAKAALLDLPAGEARSALAAVADLAADRNL
ncbi:polyprenyl synthetase family protein [Streptomyces sp. NPDC054796]